MATKEVTFQNYDSSTGEFYTDTKTCTVLDGNYWKGTIGSRDGQEYWYVVEGYVDVGWINVRGDVHLILADGSTLNCCKESYHDSAVNVETSDSFTVYGQEAGTGHLIASGGYKAAGIGGDYEESCGTITINGGVIDASGGYKGAGIGGGRKGTGSNITINGGKVNATGGDYGAGIGGGYDAGGVNITISGGTVNATGGKWGAGIGGGDYQAGHNITITGGNVTASSKYSAAGIGGGYSGTGHDITITGGTVTASGDWSAGIGGGWNQEGYNITISGGDVTAYASNYGAGIGGGDYQAGHDITISGGTVNATGANWGAGIGGGCYGTGYNITITDGVVNATGGGRAAGIGGGNYDPGHDITISGGEVTAHGGEYGAGIGGGYDGKGYNITINDGTVKAYGGDHAGGIGGGVSASGYNITINGGDVMAKGGKSTSTRIGKQGGAGIGGGGNDSSDGYYITINGGTVNAEGGENGGGPSGAGIGGGARGGDYITINAGSVTANGGMNCAGIGGGNNDGTGHDITINGGSIKAVGNGGAGVGGGNDGNAKNITVNGGEIDAYSGSGSGVGNGTQTSSSAKNIRFNADISVKAGNDEESLSEIEHTSDTDLGSTLHKKHCLTSVLATTVVDTELTIEGSETYTRSGGTVGNGGYYFVTADGELINTDYIVKFDGTSTTGNGGAIYNEGTVTLANTTFNKCWTANGSGGAVYNKGGVLTLTDATFSANRSVYGGGTASGGAIYADGGTVTVTGSRAASVFSNNQSWSIGGAVVAANGAGGTFDNVMFESNSSRNGGAVAVEGSELTFANTTFTGNAANALNNNGGLGGAILLKKDGAVNLCNVTFEGNTATKGGAIYAEEGSTINLTGSVYLNNSTDTIVNYGTLNWDVSGKSDSTGYISDYSLVNNHGDLTITVNPDEKYKSTYVLASNAGGLKSKSFTLTGVDGLDDVAITVGGGVVEYNETYYLLTVNSDNELVLKTEYSQVEERSVVSDKLILAGVNAAELSDPELDGGVFMVESTGTLTLIGSNFTNNSGNNGGAICNEGTTILKGVTFNNNTSSDGDSGAVYNTGTLILSGDVILSTDSDTITSEGELVWRTTPLTNGYISDWEKLNNTGTLTITGGKVNRCGQYVLASNAAAADGLVFTLKAVTAGQEETEEWDLTVNGDIIQLNDIYYARLNVDSSNDLLLTVTAERTVVKSNQTFEIQDGMAFQYEEMESEQTAEDEDGGLFYVSEGATLTNDGAASISGFHAHTGGAICTNGGSLLLSNMTFSDNHGDGWEGGAISAVHAPVVTLDNTVFSGNSAHHNGGALDLEYCNEVTITNSVFEQNTASNVGGAIYITITSLQSYTLTLKNVEFNGNQTHRSGGALSITQVDAYLDNVTFNGNTVTDPQDEYYANSGAISNGHSTLHLQGNVMLVTDTDRIFSFNGSIIWEINHDKTGYLSNYANLFTREEPEYQVVYSVDATNADVNKAYVLAGNAATADGQSFTFGSGTLIVNGESVENDGEYATLYVNDENNLVFCSTQRVSVDGTASSIADSLVFTTNGNAYSGNGGAIEVKNGGTLTISATDTTPVIFRNSAASGNGGAIYVADGTLELANVIFDGNSAAHGGAISVESGSQVNLTGNVSLTGTGDTIVCNGTLNWELSQNNVTVDGFQYIDGSVGELWLTVSPGMNEAKSYVVGTGDFSGTYAQNFYLHGDDAGSALITVNGDTVSYGGFDYTLKTVDDQLVLSAAVQTPAKSDINGNGISELVFQYTGGDYRIGFWMDGTSDWQSDDAPLTANWTAVKARDMNSDGEADVVMFGKINDSCGAIGYYESGSADSWVNIGSVSDPDNWEIAVGNVTGKTEKNSIILRYKNSGDITVWLDGSAEIPVTLEGTFGDGWSLIGTGDFDGSGTEEIIVSYNGDLYTVNQDSDFEQLVSGWGSAWQVGAIGDFSNDGKDDIILFHGETGAMVKLNDGNGDWDSIGQLDAQDWSVVGAGDYNGDRIDDLLVRQNSTGTLGYYAGGDQSKWNELGCGVGTSWAVIA